MKNGVKRKAAKPAGMVIVGVPMTVWERRRIKRNGAKNQRGMSAEIRYQMNRAYGAEASA